MTPEFVKRYSAPVPRYTSYPTAPHFSNAIGDKEYAAWLAALPERARLSLYLHIPFCDTLCWYCGCNTKAVRRYEPVADYLQSLMDEISGVARRVPRTHQVTHIHWGGGSPNILSSKHITDLAAGIRARLNASDDAEFAVEVDPRGLSGERIAAFAQAGVTRVSIGVQDFDPKVQAAINRVQSFEATKRVVELFREHGVTAINIDLVYGLPHQTRESISKTIEQVMALGPNRIATFGYAHLPDRLVHQRLIKQSTLPDVVERFAQSNRLARMLVAAGYVRIGLDHFAHADDPLVTGVVSRNFQGYTNDLIWSQNMQKYLMGEREPMIDLMAWNADSTRMPYRMHSEYLRRLYLNNDLAEGRFEVDGRPITITDIRAPVFCVGTLRDHVAPWRSIYKWTWMTDTDVTFVLTSGGHNAGIVSEPGHAGRYYQIATKEDQDLFIDPDTWAEETPLEQGSWWTEWTHWLGERSGKNDSPPPLGVPDKGLRPLCDAPGTFVQQS